MRSLLKFKFLKPYASLQRIRLTDYIASSLQGLGKQDAGREKAAPGDSSQNQSSQGEGGGVFVGEGSGSGCALGCECALMLTLRSSIQ